MSTEKPSVSIPPKMGFRGRKDNGYKYTVDVLYGPTNICGFIKHRSTRIENIKST